MRIGIGIFAAILTLMNAVGGSASSSSAAGADSAAACPAPRGVGSIAPAIVISSMVLAVNGIERTVCGDDTLNVSPGDEIRLRSVVVCIEPFTGDGGSFCVDVSPADRDGGTIFSEHRGTHLTPVAAGIAEMPDLDYTWVVGEDWGNLTAVVNHWTPGKSKDPACAGGLCERDDWIIIEIR